MASMSYATWAMSATSTAGSVAKLVERVGPGTGDDPDVLDAVLVEAGAEGPAHAARRLDRDDRADLEGERQRVAARAGADVEPVLVLVRPVARRASSAGSPVRRGSATNRLVTGA